MNAFTMKKILLLIFVNLFGVHLMALDKSGAISTETWSGSITVTGTVTVGNGVVLTIDPGTVVSFNSSTSLIIQGTGIIHANGTAANKITFTRNGELATWEHIRFLATSTGSNLTHCNISFGNGADISAGVTQGGGLYISGSGLTVDNCEISNCTALYGGGIEIENCNPIISNCKIHDNSNEGIDVFFGSPVIKNCLIYKNFSTNLSAGINITSGDPDILNCTIVENTVSSTDRTARGGMYVFESTPHVINTLFWNNKRGTLNGNDYAGSTSNMQRCALVQSVLGQFLLSTTNTAINGPNFSDPSTYDYSLKFISVCRDSGFTVSQGVTIPANDILGNPTIGMKDIGAYEVKYSLWTGSTDNSWSTASNWDKNNDPPSGTGDVLIPAGLSRYPVNTSNGNFTIGSGKKMILEPAAKVTLNAITNNGSLLLESDGNGISSLIVNSYSGNNADVQVYLTGGPVPDGRRWHLISSPFTALNISPFSTVTLDLAQWIEDWDRMSLDEGWVAFDGYIYPSGLMTGPQFNNFNPGKGYTYYYASNRSYTISGQLNTTSQTMTITCKDPEQQELYGLNLMGNPFSSGLNWDAIVSSSNYPAGTSKALHYRKDGTHVYYINGVGSVPGVNGIIPPMQGFFVKTNEDGGSLILDADARVHDNIPARYKGSAPEIPLVRLKISTGSLADYTTVRFDENAKTGADNDFDAPKEFLSTVRPSIYTISEGSRFTINGLPFPSPYTDIPVVLKLITAGNHILESPEITGLENYRIKLIDRETWSETDLRTNPVIPFSSGAGLITDRFVLRVAELTTDIDNPVVSGKEFSIYPANGLVNIRMIDEKWDNHIGSVKLLDLNGRIIKDLPNVLLTKTSITQLTAPASKGLYIVEVRSGIKRYTTKVLIP